ncbi:MAG: acyl-CoA dehydrogenase [Nevskia sp.]|nr:acyl-CoA dehydrogenase [Nevskia sp.]
MDLTLTDDQLMIREAAQSFLADTSDSAAVRSAMASSTGFDAAVWQRIAGELGWCATAVPEQYGGLGLGPVALALLLEQMGRHLLCAPFFSTVCLAANWLAEGGCDASRQRFLPEIAEGKLRLTMPVNESANDWIDGKQVLRARREGAGWRLDGICARVPDAGTADWLLLPARLDERSGQHWATGMFAVPRNASGLNIDALETWDATRRFFRVELNGVTLMPQQRVDHAHRGIDGAMRSAALARLYLAAEQLGGAQACLDLTVAHTATRKQFGRTLASFQAVKHRCAEMMVRIEALRSAVYGAAAYAADSVHGEPPEALALECAMASALAADTYFYCAQEAIQLHGGVGFTWEYDPQLYFKRAQASSHWFGTADALRERIAAAVFA